MLTISDDVAKEYARQARHAKDLKNPVLLQAWLNAKTWGELDIIQLAVLTDMVAKRLKERNFS